MSFLEHFRKKKLENPAKKNLIYAKLPLPCYNKQTEAKGG